MLSNQMLESIFDITIWQFEAIRQTTIIFQECKILRWNKLNRIESGPNFEKKSSRGGLEVERLLHKLHESISVGSNLARHQKDHRSNSNTTGGALVNNV